MPAGRDKTPAPTMFFARLSVDDVTDDLDATAAPPGFRLVPLVWARARGVSVSAMRWLPGRALIW